MSNLIILEQLIFTMKKYLILTTLSLLLTACAPAVNETTEPADESVDTEAGTELTVSGTYEFSEFLNTLVFTVDEVDSSIVDGNGRFTFTNSDDAQAALVGSEGKATIMIKNLVKNPEEVVDGPGYTATFVSLALAN
jgi:hypothetical protein